MTPQILLLDNTDSFVHNLARYVSELGLRPMVVRSDALTLDEIRGIAPCAIILSPGPCTPRQTGVCMDVVRELGPEVPILGVCLGHQAIAAALGGRIVRAPEAVHGRTCDIQHEGSRLFEGLPSPLRATRYHSLIVEEASLPPELKITGRSPDGLLMAFEHARWPLFGVQFHPESVLTRSGHALLANFLRIAGTTPTAEPPGDLIEPGPVRDFYEREVKDDTSPLPAGATLS